MIRSSVEKKAPLKIFGKRIKSALLLISILSIHASEKVLIRESDKPFERIIQINFSLIKTPDTFFPFIQNRKWGNPFFEKINKKLYEIEVPLVGDELSWIETTNQKKHIFDGKVFGALDQGNISNKGKILLYDLLKGLLYADYPDRKDREGAKFKANNKARLENFRGEEKFEYILILIDNEISNLLRSASFKVFTQNNGITSNIIKKIFGEAYQAIYLTLSLKEYNSTVKDENTVLPLSPSKSPQVEPAIIKINPTPIPATYQAPSRSYSWVYIFGGGVIVTMVTKVYNSLRRDKKSIKSPQRE